MSDSHGRLNDRTAIVTGASRGIGRATALLFAGEGASVVVADVNTDDGTEVVESIESDGGTASFVSVDVTDSEQVQAMVDHAIEMYGGVDILVNNAGITKDATLKKMSEEAFDQVVDVNLKGVFNCTKAALPALTDSAHGRVLNAASVVGLYGNFGQTNYVATKSGVIGMTKTWARELGRDGVTVNAVAPGFIETPMVDTVPDKVLEQLKGRTPLGRLGTSDDIAHAYLFLASDEASFITGAVLSVDGGLVL
ncbi:MAG: 3-oxoacyl-ACP reductase FabG [Bacteroidetes bacterium]|jgi:3-oxoacyl-[acyl-carrier protein] reductase|nr:3-oxoacyl-ACP reductase FabG [Bacteroidota bacterium]